MGQQNQQIEHSEDTTPDLFVSNAKENGRVQELQARVQAIVKECFPDPDTLIEAIEATGLPVIAHGPEFQLKMAMMLVGVRPGYISPSHNRYSEFIETVVKLIPNKADTDFSKGVLLVLKENFQFAPLAYEFYHWMAFQEGLPGYNDTARSLYQVMNQKHQGQLNEKFLDTLGLEETLMLKAAIRRDKEAFQFIRRLLHEVFVPLNNGKRLDSGEAQA